MELNINHNFYCGSSRGFIANSTWRKNDPNTSKPHFNTEYKGDEISLFEFGRTTHEIVVGTIKGNIRLYDVISQSYTSTNLLNTEPASEIVGSGCVQNNIVFCRKNGIVTIWNPSNKMTSHFTVPIINDGDIRKLRRNEYRDNLFAVAGHKHEYSLWDLEQKKIIFAAKSLPADKLYQLPQTTFANDLCMLNFGGGHVTAIVTAEGTTILYDDRAQRRPVFILKKECKGGALTSFTCVKTARGLDHLLTVGTTRGAVHLLDLRVKEGYIGAITGYNGAVTSLAPMTVGSNSAMASTCLDGNLRVHCLKTKQLLHKMYMKVSLKGVLTQPVILKQSELKQIEESDEINETRNLDDLFATMETIADENDSNLIIPQISSEQIQSTSNLKGKSKKDGDTHKFKSHDMESQDEEVEINPIEMKATELQKLWKENIDMLINTDPFKLHMDHLLSREIKIEEDDEPAKNVAERNDQTVVKDNENTSMKKLKRKNSDAVMKSEDTVDDQIDDVSNVSRTDGSTSTDKLKRVSIVQLVNKRKKNKNFGEKKSKKNIIRIKAAVA